jgi:hypothetical protein
MKKKKKKGERRKEKGERRKGSKGSERKNLFYLRLEIAASNPSLRDWIMPIRSPFMQKSLLAP